ncbi:MAG: pantetheine-phosphate adenylyltransferase [Eubacteriales bacterium]|jgi:pantetheine-phosphate adenylyltransferase|nr:pantetheine-phosphate adenylyltransferase [Eubacteriales bacterium]MDO5586018.1 pantetheine-phosphate adenylyltransferase [Clostridia bacterium]MDY4212635.1 pantetheine-phosphate adenylyltransferase [Eubacteriales bacterium]MDY5229745.1 pantetheine-phosphate adenylyltransferase [Eubacteriales bacterium]
MSSAVYPGSFDPCTNGHLDIIDRSAQLFDKVIVAVLTNSSKTPVFTVSERIELLKTATADYSNVEVCSFSGLLVDFLRKIDVKVVIKGIRAVSDFEYEFQMALTNKALYPELETLFMHSSQEYMFLSSSVVREVAKYGGSLTGLVPEELIPIVEKRCFEG